MLVLSQTSRVEEELGNHKLCLVRPGGGVLPSGRALPEVDPTQPTKMAPFQTAANTLVLLNNFLDKSIPSWYSVLVTGRFSNSPIGRSRRLAKGPEANKERPDVYEK